MKSHAERSEFAGLLVFSKSKLPETPFSEDLLIEYQAFLALRHFGMDIRRRSDLVRSTIKNSQQIALLIGRKII